jgi:hypothetical protein
MAGCKIVGVTPDLQKPAPNGEFYLSEGCYELIRNLQQLMNHLGVELLLNSKLESVFVDYFPRNCRGKDQRHALYHPQARRNQ